MKKILLAIAFATVSACGFAAEIGDTIHVHIPGIMGPKDTAKQPFYVFKVTSNSPQECSLISIIKEDSGANKIDYSLTIPSTANFSGETYPVTAIGNDVGYQLSCMTSLTIPESVKSIGETCFNNCSKLASLDLGGVTTIGKNSFYFSYSNTKVPLKILDLSKVTSIGNNCFSGFANLTDVTLSDDLETLGSGTFSDCPKVELNFSEDATMTIIDNVLYKKNEERTQPETLVKTLPDFNATTLTIPATVTAISSSAFRDNTALTSVNLGGNLTEIPYGLFWGCSNLKEVTGTGNVESIGYYAFYNCSTLESFNVGPKVTDIALVKPADSSNTARCQAPFMGCTGLKSFTVDSENPVYSATDGVLFNKEQTELLYYVVDDKETYSAPSGVTSVADFAFANPIPNPKSQYSPFAGSDKLKTLTLGNDVESVGANLFKTGSASNQSVQTLELGPKVTTIGEGAFQNLQGLTNVKCYSVEPPAFTPADKADNAFYTTAYNTATLGYPDGSEDAYKTAAGWRKFAKITTGIDNIEAAGNGGDTWRYYNLQGIEVQSANLFPGIYVRRAADGKTGKIIIR